MGGEGRGSAVVLGMAVMVVAVVVVSHFPVADAAVYTVGGAGGWTFNVASWPKGKRFMAGDTLVFNYNSQIHNVVSVNGAGYKGCITPRGAKTYTSGRDQVKLVKGQNFFICNFPGHCEGGMKIAVFAS